MRFLRGLLLHNWGLKLLALLLAFLLWATFTAEPFVEIGFQVPVEFRNLPPPLDVSDDAPAQVRVRVRGRSTLVRRLTPADLTISLDLSGVDTGDMVVPLSTSQVLELPPGVELVRIVPAELRLRIVDRNSRRE
ncbi:MAG TPA: CdaR family protein [Candidatus Acidoferrales bacterium]